MIRRDYLVVGASIGGASACEGIRKYDKRGSVTLVGAEAFPPYKRWILSKTFLREKEANLKKLQELDERWFETHKVEARTAKSREASTAKRHPRPIAQKPMVTRSVASPAECSSLYRLLTAKSTPPTRNGAGGMK